MAGPVPFCVFRNDLERGADSDELVEDTGLVDLL